MTVIRNDTFTGTSGTDLEAHTADSGESWTTGGTAGNQKISASNTVYRASAPAVYLLGPNLSDADYQMDLVLDVKSVIAGDIAFIMGRATDATNAYRVILTTTTITLDKIVANSPTTLGSVFSNTLTTGAHTLSLKMQGNQISMLWDAAVVGGPVTDSTFASPGKPGMRIGAVAITQTVTTGIHGNSLQIDMLQPVNTVLPAITGTATLGQVLTVSNGTWDNSPSSYAYQWKRDGTDIVGATASTYTIVLADSGHLLSCVVTATGGGGSTAATSASVSIQASGFRDFHTLAQVEFTGGRYWKNNGCPFDTAYNEPNALGPTAILGWSRTNLDGSFFNLADSYGIHLGQAVQESSIRQGGGISATSSSSVLDITAKDFTIMLCGVWNDLSIVRCPMVWGDNAGLSTAGRYMHLTIETDGRIAFACDWSRTEEIISAAGVIKRGVRALIVITYTQSSGLTKLYVNGIEVASGTTQGLRGSNTGITATIGAAKVQKRTDTGLVLSGYSTSATMTTSQTTVPTATSLAPVPTSGVLVINQEEMSYTHNGTTLTVVRGRSFSKVHGHASSSAIIFRHSHWGPGNAGGFAAKANYVMSQATALALTQEAGFDVPLPYTIRISSPDSWATRPLPDDAPIAGDSPTMVTNIANQARTVANGGLGTWCNYNGYTPTVYVATMADPCAYVRNNHSPIDTRMGHHWTAVHMPVGATPAVGTDQEMVVWNSDSDEYHEFWAMSWDVQAHTTGVNGIGEANWGGYVPELSRFLGHYSGSRNGWGTTACGIGLLTGLILIDEVIAGRIPHQLALALHPFTGSPKWHYPAQRSDGWVANGPREGDIFRLPADYPWWNLPYRFTRILARAAVEYGIHIRDNAGAVSFYAERPTPARVATLPGAVEPWINSAGLNLMSTGAGTGGPATTTAVGTFPWASLQRLDETWVQSQFGSFTSSLRRTGPSLPKRIELNGSPTPVAAQSKTAVARLLHNTGSNKIRFSPDHDQLFTTPSTCAWINAGTSMSLDGWGAPLYACTDDGLAGTITITDVIGAPA